MVLKFCFVVVLLSLFVLLRKWKISYVKKFWSEARIWRITKESSVSPYAILNSPRPRPAKSSALLWRLILILKARSLTEASKA